MFDEKNLSTWNCVYKANGFKTNKIKQDFEVAVQKSDVNLSSVFYRRDFEKDPWSVSDLIRSLFVEHPVHFILDGKEQIPLTAPF